MSAVALENDVLKATFDSQTGALVGLESKATGWRIQNREALGLSFRLLVPLPDRRNNFVLGQNHNAAICELSKDKKRLTLVWKDLKPEHCGPLDIRLTATVTLDESGLTFNAEIENRSPYVVESLSYPCLGDIPMPSGDEPLDRRNCHCELVKVPLLPTFPSEKGYWGVDSPTQMATSPLNQFVLIASDKQGLYAGCHDENVRTLVQFSFELKPGHESWLTFSAPPGDEIAGKPAHLQFSAIQFPFCAPGETWRMSPVVLKPYVGTWHKGVDNYKQWVAGWMKYPRTPAWAREVHSWHQLHINSPESELRCRFTDLVKYGEACARHGVRAIQLVGWNHGGQDGGNPSHDFDPRLGTLEEFRDAIAKIHEMGVKIILFNKYTWADITTDWYRNELHQYAAKDPYGDAYRSNGYQYQTPAQLSGINVHNFSSMCHNSPTWREIACREFEKNFQYGAAGMLYDEGFHHGAAYYCFDPTHGHHVPECLFAGDEPLADGFRAIADEKDPDFLFAGEAFYEHQFRYYSLTYFRIRAGHVPAQRYIDPHALIMTAVAGFNDRDTINLCLLYRYIISYEPYNFKGALDDFPPTIEYGKKVVALRKRYAEYLWDAEFRHVLGASVTVNGTPHEPYSVFVQPKTGKRAVAVANHDQTSEIEALVQLETPSPRLVLATPEQPEPQETDGRVVVPPRSVAVIMEV